MSPRSDLDTLAKRRLVALNATPDVSRATLCRLAADDAWLRRRGRGRPAGGSRVTERSLVRARRRLDRADEIAAREDERACRSGARIVSRLDADYPAALRALSDPPAVLYCRGEVPDAPAVAIVGSRRADAYGLEAAESFARHLGTVGMVIVSGLARGVDSAAHRGALAAACGRTVAVLGCGIDVTYPRGSGELARRIAGAGAVLSEFPTRTAPLPEHFPMRNRIIAALALGTFVVRATARSGSLITARLALDLGRDVYALPGNVFDPRSIGPNALIRDGALPVLHPRDIVECLPWREQRRLRISGSETPSAEPAPPLQEHLKQVFGRLSRTEPRTVEALASGTGRSVAEVLSALLELELDGLVRRGPGPTFCRRG